MRVFQKFDDFLQFIAGLINTGNIVKGNLAMLFSKQFRFRLAKAHCPASAATLLHLAQNEECDAQDQQERKRLINQQQQEAWLFLCLRLYDHTLFIKQGV